MSGQEWATLAAVAIAAVYLIRRALSSIRGRRGACGNCGSCSVPPGNDRLPERKQLYSLSPAKPKDGTPSST